MTAPKLTEHVVRIPVERRILEGILRVPAAARGIVAFAHGSGSGRHSPRNQFVAGVLREGGLATLLLDLLDGEEAADRACVFDIDLLAGRLQGAANWLTQHAQTRKLGLGYFGASTGAAAALTAAARDPQTIRAVVSRGGRPDLAWEVLPAVRAPTRLIVGSLDVEVLHLNRKALEALSCPKDLVVVPGATHLFPEPGTLEQVADLAREWFEKHLPT